MTVNISGTTGIDTVNNTALVSKTIESPTLTGTVVYPSGQTIASPIFTGSPVITSAGGGLITLTPVSTASNFTLTVPAKTSTIDTLARTGNVLQVVQGTTTGTSTTSTSYVTTNLTATITPSSAANKILVHFSIAAGTNAADKYIYFTIFKGTVAGTNLGPATGFGTLYGGNSANQCTISSQFLDSPSTTSAQIYTIGFKVSAGTGYACTNSETATITLMEIAG